MIAEIIWLMIATYLFAGFVFAIAFIIKGVNVIDEATHESSIGFRIIIIPGTIVFWPLLLKKWIKAKKKKND